MKRINCSQELVYIVMLEYTGFDKDFEHNGAEIIAVRKEEKVAIRILKDAYKEVSYNESLDLSEDDRALGIDQAIEVAGELYLKARHGNGVCKIKLLEYEVR